MMGKTQNVNNAGTGSEVLMPGSILSQKNLRFSVSVPLT
jgi:hypothetical protein